MKKTETFFRVQNSFSRDALSDFISQMKIIPHAFGHQVNDPGAQCDNRITGDFEIIYVIGGESYITIGHRYYVCGPGDYVIIPPFTRHKIQTHPKNPHNNYWLHFDIYPFYLQDAFTKAMTCNSEYKVNIGISEEILSLYRKLEEEMERSEPGSSIFFHTKTTEILTSVLRVTSNSQVYTESVDSLYRAEARIVDKSMEFIQDHIHGQIRIADLSSFLHVSESYVFKAFERMLNMSPNNFILMCKIKKAEQMMKITDMPFKEISEYLGFSSPYYFSTVFKRFFSMSPREYTRSQSYTE